MEQPWVLKQEKNEPMIKCQHSSCTSDNYHSQEGGESWLSHLKEGEMIHVFLTFSSIESINRNVVEGCLRDFITKVKWRYGTAPLTLPFSESGDSNSSTTTSIMWVMLKGTWQVKTTTNKIFKEISGLVRWLLIILINNQIITESMVN